MIRFRLMTVMFWALAAWTLAAWPGLVAPARAQGSRKDDIVLNARGLPLAGATVRVCATPASGQPCAPLALIYSDAALTQALANPATTDGLGNYFFYAAPGKYMIEISGPGITTRQIPNVILPSDPTAPAFSSLSSTGGITAFSLNLSGNLTVNGSASVIGPLAGSTLSLTNQLTPPGAPGAGSVSFYTKSSDKRLYYKDDTGAEIGPIANATGAQTNVSNTFAAAQNFDANVALKGPSPWIDILRYGASGDSTTTTGSITAGTPTPTLTLAAAANFVNGQGIVVWKAGPNPTMATPAAPASVTPTNITGATTYTYQVVGVDSAGGVTATSPSATTATGPATLGYNTATIVAATGLSRVAGVVTVTTTAAHGFNVTNVPVRIAGAADVTFNGVWMITGTPAGSSFTFNQSGFPDATSGGGTATVTAFNKITVTAVTGASYYVIYGRVAGSLTLIGRTEWNGTTFNDYGATIGAAPTLPAYVPTAPPAAATPRYLATTVSSGGGTTTLTLAANASTTATSQTVKHDDGPALVAAINAAVANGGGTVYLPPAGVPLFSGGTTFQFNSTFTLPTAARFMSILLGGGMNINETIIGASNYSFRNVLGGSSAAGGAQFQGQPQVTVIGAANPLLYFGSGANNSLEFEGITFVGSGSYGNGQNVLFLDARPAQVAFRRSSFSTNAGLNNFTGAPLLIRGGFDYYFTDCLFASNGNGNVNTIAPVALFGVESGGEAARYVYMQNSVFNFAGVKFDYTGVVTGTMGNVFRNILVENLINNDAFLITFGAFGNQGWVLDNIQVSDVSGPVWNNLNSNLQGAIILNSTPWVGGPLVTGLPILGLQIFNSPSNTNVPRAPGNYADQTFAAILDTGVNPGTGSLTGVTTQNQAAHSENNAPLYWDMKPPASPTGVLAAGGTLTVGTTYFYKITAVDVRNGQTKPSVEVGPVTPTAGNQTVSLSWTAPTGPVKGYYVYRGTSAGGEGTGLYPSGVGTPTTTATSFSDTGGIATNGASLPSVSGAGVTKLDQTGVVAGNVNLGGEAFTASPRGVLGAFLPGALTAIWTGATLTLDKAITVTRFQVQLKTAPVGCATNAVVRLTDGTTPVNVTITATANDSGAISQNYAAGAVLTLGVATAAATCTTAPADANVLAQYRMQ